MYGERLGATAVAADADRVVVAYEDPNGESSSVSLAISANMGHIFGRRVSVSGANGDASAPQVALHRGVVAVSWIERSASAMAHIVRIGVIQ